MHICLLGGDCFMLTFQRSEMDIPTICKPFFSAAAYFICRCRNQYPSITS